jgi:hypothetical protein
MARPLASAIRLAQNQIFNRLCLEYTRTKDAAFFRADDLRKELAIPETAYAEAVRSFRAGDQSLLEVITSDGEIYLRLGETARDNCEGNKAVPKLRDHGLMRYRGICSWPPTWTNPDPTKKCPTGEVGTLEDALMNDMLRNELFVIMRYEGEGYMGALSFDDPAFCHTIYELLKLHRGKPINQIGDLNLS